MIDKLVKVQIEAPRQTLKTVLMEHEKELTELMQRLARELIMETPETEIKEMVSNAIRLEMRDLARSVAAERVMEAYEKVLLQEADIKEDKDNG